MIDSDLIVYVQEHAGVAPADLAARAGVSTRTVRKRIAACNDALAGAAAITYERNGAQGSGYYVVVSDAARFEELLARARQTRTSSLPENSEERVSFLLNYLLLQTDWITREQLAEILYVSPNSITAALRDVERILGEFNLTLQRRPRYGVRVAGSEMARRLCLANAAVSELDADSLQAGTGLSVLNSLLPESSARSDTMQIRLMLDRLDTLVSDVVGKSNFHVNSFSYQNLLVHIGIALVRIQKGCYVPMATEQLEPIRQSDEYAVARKIAQGIEHEFDIHLPEEEVAYISIHLAGKQIIQLEGAPTLDGSSPISDEVWSVVTAILERVWSTYRFDLRGDLELRMNLAQHIVPLSVRLNYSLEVRNPMADEIKARYPLAYAMALEAAGVLAHTYGSELSDNEVSYLALSFALSLERQKTGHPKKNILVVCASGRGSASLLGFRYRQEFGDYIETITSCDVHHIDQVDLSRIDYVFTTVPLNQSLPVPVREVGYFLNDDDILAIRSVLHNDTSRHAEGVERYFDSRLFFTHLRFAAREDVLSFLCDAVCATGLVDDTFTEQVQLRERAAPTAFGGLVALPHPYAPVSDVSFVAVGLLDDPVEWNGHEVQAVFLLCIAREPDDDLTSFYDKFSNLMFNEQAIRCLLEDQRFEVLERVFLGAD